MNISQREFSRRQLLIRSGLVGAAGLSLPAILAACGGDDGEGDAMKLLFENWPEYIDVNDGDALGTIDRFIAASGVATTYSEAYNDNLEYFAKIQPLLGTGKRIEADIIAPTQWMAGRLRKLDWLEKLPLDKIPNSKNLEDAFKNPPSDPTGEYSLPWQSGIAGIAYNIDATGRELKSIADLFDPAFKGKIGMLTEMRDTIGLICMSLGIDPSKIASFEDAAPAFEKLAQAKNDGQIRAFTGNDYTDDLVSGNFAACVGWSGDVLQLGKDSPNVRFVIPEEGGTSWCDTMILPKGVPNASAAAKWMNFCYDPVQAAQITQYVQYLSPVKGVRDELAKLDPELAENTLLFPDDATKARLRSFATLSEDVEAKFDEEFSAITGA
jgi:spermidine/putrescine transport system substrate-binding protein